jgi:DNA-binding NarL/FixJ family response regulator
MLRNCYEGVLEAWKVELIRRRARRFRFRDMEDVEQQVVMALLDDGIDATNGAHDVEVALLTTVIDRLLIGLRRTEARVKRYERQDVEFCDTDGTNAAIHLDLVAALQSLPERDQWICDALSMGLTISEIARLLDTTWHTVQFRIKAIRRHFKRLGISNDLPRETEE